MTGRLRDRTHDDDPVVARAAGLLSSSAPIPDSPAQRERVARRIAAADTQPRAWPRWLIAGCATALAAAVTITAWRASRTERRPVSAGEADRSVRRARAVPRIVTIPGERATVPPPAFARPEDVLWANDHEANALDKWMLGGSALGGRFSGRHASYAVTTEQARSGRSSLVFRSDTSVAKRDVTAQAYRNGFLPEEGYYSAWFLLPERYSIPDEDYWGIMVFRSKRLGARERGTADPLFVVNVMNDSISGEMGLEVWDHVGKRFLRAERPAPIAAGRWFHVEIFLRATDDGAGQFVLWQDGQEQIRHERLQMPPHRYLYWAIGSSARRLSPPVGVVFVDDVAVSRSRLGPGAAPQVYQPQE